MIDGAQANAVASAQTLVGSHWVHVTCADRAPWGTRVEVTGDQLVVARNAQLTPPTDDELLIQARTVGARAFVVVEIRSGVGSARLVGVDGRERDRRNVATTARGDLSRLAHAVQDLLAPVDRPQWYESRWVWAGGAAVLAAAIAIPLTAALTQGSSPSTFSVRPVFQWR
jgi:hypothetical protein